MILGLISENGLFYLYDIPQANFVLKMAFDAFY